jgi:predicted nicotinamide N-methyase
LVASLGELQVERVELPGTSDSFDIARPVDYDRLIDEAAGDPEQNLPYWAEIWPSGVALAACIVREPRIVSGKRVLELGCGLGVTAIAALRAGAELLVTDYSPAALALCALNTQKEVGRLPESLRMNWRDQRSSRLFPIADPFPVVLAADVLYERRDIAPLLALTKQIVALGGELWLAEPNRVPALLAVETLKTRGWVCETERCNGPWPDPEDNRKGVVVSIHRLRRSGAG